MTSNKISQIVEMIESLTVVELKELVDAVKEKFGVSAIAMAPAQQVSVQETAAPVEEKTNFEVVLTSFGNSKLNVIKEVRTITGLGLKEAKDLVEGVPKTLKSDVTKEEANKIKEIIEKAGGTVELK